MISAPGRTNPECSGNSRPGASFGPSSLLASDGQNMPRESSGCNGLAANHGIHGPTRQINHRPMRAAILADRDQRPAGTIQERSEGRGGGLISLLIHPLPGQSTCTPARFITI